MNKRSTKAFLLKRTLLPNDDGVLEFFTLDYGRLSLFIPKLARSKKKILEIDFFRLLEIEFQAQKLKPKTIHSLESFEVFKQDYEASQKGFGFMQRLLEVLPSEKALPDLFHILYHVWHLMELEDLNLFQLFLEIKILEASGICPRFDTKRGDVYIHPGNFDFSATDKPEYIFIPHEHRQVLEFLRRSRVEDLFNKKETLPQQNLEAGYDLIEHVWKYH